MIDGRALLTWRSGPFERLKENDEIKRRVSSSVPIQTDATSSRKRDREFPETPRLGTGVSRSSPLLYATCQDTLSLMFSHFIVGCRIRNFVPWPIDRTVFSIE
jgi:hypothetical protein